MARKLDRQLIDAWMGHPYFRLIDNSTGFDEKIQRVIETVLGHLGVPDPHGGRGFRKRKFLLREMPPAEAFPVAFRDFHVEHAYLISSDAAGTAGQVRIRKRGRDGHYAFTLTMRKPKLDGQSIEVRRTLAPWEYDAFCAQIDPSREQIVKNRRCFIFQSSFCQIDVYRQPRPGLIILELFVDTKADRDAASIVPAFLSAYVDREVSGLPEYSMYNFSRKTGQ